MDYQDMLKEARRKFNGTCRVCRVCDGVACRGEVPGMGGKGTGSTFIENVKAIDKIKLNMRVIHDVDKVDTSLELFGRKLSLPVMAAPITGTSLNMGGLVTEKEYIVPVVEGCKNKGTLAMVGDTAIDQFLLDNLEVLDNNGGEGIVFIKPWENDNVIKKIREAEKVGAVAVGVDIDACGLVTLSLHGKPVKAKTVDEIKELVQSTELPFILKGIMTPDEAEKAVEAGVYGIVVSNHGGRVQDYTPGTADVLEDIAKVVNKRIKVFVDGGIRTGVDVLKMIALGADACLIGRPFVTASFGGEVEGVEMYIDRLKSELEGSMILTGCKNLESIDSRVIYGR
ncbi:MULTISPECIES: alpha-hydroxy-acid oxidizing protein [Peptostreptococcus]|uniref:L-lactate oxidase n=2 Tax=Peptostreptococcus anaerobius TaxID=1261 RepID=D3MT59_9FIRM|nr:MULTISPECIES: alpha-hydroxy-acid oxidizing protein [Peptostreptococcus]EFD04716.1 dehydrogenase, FMN-dependent [Peptostreptococcus anaerobius 653-L]KXB73455.1 dehydrogenase, FMN-dependent [Peptostreptococcus anaerobius]KXI14401.1 dehydrogenase, FMN-dependent [Peptostreptococcus anaerobius]MBS5596959.1 alpha-hydroxy-acid oxidizing protein [Peptostreptococcus sp.]MCB6983344.1 alpha-hydroxy-acid oxidizing protein [Peptostreptococcus anaerobius]